MDGRDRAPPTQAGSGGGDDEVGEEVYAPERPQDLLAEEVDRGEDLLVIGTEQEDEQGLRAASGELGSLHLRGDEPPEDKDARTDHR